MIEKSEISMFLTKIYRLKQKHYDSIITKRKDNIFKKINKFCGNAWLLHRHNPSEKFPG